MASIIPDKNGYRAFVCVKKTRDSKFFHSLREARVWASQRETELRKLSILPESKKHTFADAMYRYGDEISPTRRGAKWEILRIGTFLRDPSLPVGMAMGDLTPDQFAEWRDARGRLVKPGTVLREIGLMSAIFERARLEWRWIDSNPLRSIRKPSSPSHREVVISASQIKAMLRELGYSPSAPVRGVAQAVAVCFLSALRTGMRAGELCGLTWENVKVDYCILPVTKTKPRNVPLDPKALRVINKMKGFDPALVFGIKAASLDAMFRKYRQRAGLEGFTFHDSRHTAATRIAQKVDVLTLCKIFGWSNPKQALTYYNPSASKIASMLTFKPPPKPDQPR